MAKAFDIVFAIGDVHGRADLLARLHSSMEARVQKLGIKNSGAKVVYLGDLIDRGPRSKDVIDLAIHGLTGFKKIFLRGNHEYFMNGLIGEQFNFAAAHHWIRSGGDATLRSYGVDCQGVDDFAEYPLIYREEFLEALPEEHLRFFKEMKNIHIDTNTIFVHAGLNPQKPLRKQSVQDMLCIREPFLRSRKNWGKIVVHGHTPQRCGPDLKKNRLNVDTAAQSNGNLTAACFYAGKVDFLVTSSPRKHFILIDLEEQSNKLWLKWNFDRILASGATKVSLCMKKPDSAIKLCEKLGFEFDIVNNEGLILSCADRESDLLYDIEQGDTVLAFANKPQQEIFYRQLRLELGLDEPSPANFSRR